MSLTEAHETQMHSSLQSVMKSLQSSHERRELLSAVQGTNLLQRLAAVEACRQNSYAPAWTSVEHPSGDRMEIILTEEVSRQIYLFGAFEEELSFYIAATLKPGSVFIDAGAHYGYFSLLASNLVGPTGRVIAVEPHPETIELLRRNTSAKANVEIVQKAVWTSSGSIPFMAAPAALSAFSSAIGIRLPAGAAEAAKEVTVESVSIDDLCEQHGIRPDFLKLDVESAEMQAIRGSERTLRNNRPIVSIEVGDFDHLVAQGIPTSLEVLEEVASMGYEFLELVGNSTRPHQLVRDQPYSYSNIIAVPRS